jgi:hypothetical protein
MTLRRFEDDIVGTTDAAGNATLTWRGMTGESFAGIIIGLTTGFPSWEVDVNGAPVALGQGIAAPLTVPLLMPGDIVKLKVTGATTTVPVRGHVIGYASDNPLELPIAPLGGAGSGVPVGASTAPPLTGKLTDVNTTPGTFSFTIAPAGIQKFTLNVPPAAKALRVVAAITPRSQSTFTYSMRAFVGADIAGPGPTPGILWPQSNAEGTVAAPLFPARPVVIPLDTAWIGAFVTGAYQVVLEIGGDPASTLGFVVTALFDIESMDVWSQLPLTVSGSGTFSDDVTDRILRQLGRVVLVTPGNFNIIIDDQGAGNVNLGTSQLNARPAPWQSPNKVSIPIGSSIAAAGVLNLVGAVGGQTVRLFACSLAVDAVLATGTLQLEDTTPTVIHQFSTSTSPCNPYTAPGEARGVGLGIQLRNPSGSAQIVRGSLVYSQN